MKIVKEIWKPVVGYEGLYKVSNKGRVKGLRSGKILKSALNKKGTNKISRTSRACS